MRTLTHLIIAMLLAFALTGYAQELYKSDDGYETELKQRFTVTPGGNLVIDGIIADLEISTWEQPTVSIEEYVTFEVYTLEEAQERVSRWKQRYSQDGNTVTIKGNSEFDCNDCTITIKVPSSFNLDLRISNGDMEIRDLKGNVQARTSGGDIVLNSMSGEIDIQTSGGDLEFIEITGNIKARTSGGDISLQSIYAVAEIVTSGGDIGLIKGTQRMSLRTSGGDIDIKDVSGELSMSTSGGDIEVMDYSGPSLDFSTSGGDIEMLNIKGKVNAKTSGGDIEATSLHAPANVRTTGGEIELTDVRSALYAESVGGDVSADMRIMDFEANHDITLKTTGGNIHLSIPANLPATIDAELRLDGSGRDWERYDIYSDFPLTKTVPDEHGSRTLKSNGDINGGGDPIVLRTNGGNIYIKKQ